MVPVVVFGAALLKAVLLSGPAADGDRLGTVGRCEVPATPRQLNVESGITTASPSPPYSPSSPQGPHGRPRGGVARRHHAGAGARPGRDLTGIPASHEGSARHPNSLTEENHVGAPS